MLQETQLLKMTLLILCYQCGMINYYQSFLLKGYPVYCRNFRWVCERVMRPANTCIGIALLGSNICCVSVCILLLFCCLFECLSVSRLYMYMCSCWDSSMRKECTEFEHMCMLLPVLSVYVVSSRSDHRTAHVCCTLTPILSNVPTFGDLSNYLSGHNTIHIWMFKSCGI